MDQGVTAFLKVDPFATGLGRNQKADTPLIERIRRYLPMGRDSGLLAGR